MEIPFLTILFAARHHDGDPTAALIGFAVLVVVGVLIWLRESTANYDVIHKGSLPHCPRCHRQVSYRRDCCRACGYQFKTYGQPAPRPGPPALPARPGPIDSPRSTAPPTARTKPPAPIDLGIELEPPARETRRERRDKMYRAKGIEPGPLAWYFALPDGLQVTVLAAAFALPALAVLILVVRR